MSKSIWLRTSELTEAVEGLDAYVSNLKNAKRDSYYWKWAIITLHNSLQGFMVCALRGTSNLAVLSAESAREWMDAFENNKPYPKEKLDDFLNLYKKIKGNYMLQYVDSKKFVPKAQQGSSVRRLNSLRNDFIHFVPCGWSLEVSGVPHICNDIDAIIDFLVHSSGNIHFYPDDNLEKKCNDVLLDSKNLISEIKKIYAA